MAVASRQVITTKSNVQSKNKPCGYWATRIRSQAVFSLMGIVWKPSTSWAYLWDYIYWGVYRTNNL